MSDDLTYIKYSRNLHTNPVFKGFSYQYRHIFLTILVNVTYKSLIVNDHGVLIDLKPGQLMTTLRDLVRLCDEPDIDKSKIERALTFFEKCQFSRQETRHRKTIITITESSICAILNLQNETTIETKSRQDRDKIETEKKKDKKEKKDKKKEKIEKEKASEFPKIKFREFVLLSQKEFDSLLALHGKDFLDLMLDELNSYKGRTGKEYKSDYYAMAAGSWVVKKIKEGTVHETAQKSIVGRISSRDFEPQTENSKFQGRVLSIKGSA